MIEHPPGIYVLRFCTVNAQLSSTALLDFTAGRGLPSGFAEPVETPIVWVKTPAGGESERSGGEIVTDAPGLYHTLVEMLEAGEWQWEGQGREGEPSKLVSSTGVVPWLIGPAIKT